MIDHGKTRAAVFPEPVLVDENSVWVSADVHEVTVEDENGKRTEYEFTLTQYGKNEYIRLLTDRNDALETDIDNTQLALCEVYEMLSGGE